MKNNFFRQKIFWYLLAALFMIFLSGCGSNDVSVTTVYLVNDDFSGYATFPSSPWSIYVGTNAGNWSIVNSGQDYWAFYDPFPSTIGSALLNDNSNSGSDCAVTARMQIIYPSNAIFSLILRASGSSTPDEANYQVIFNCGTGIYFFKVASGISYVIGSGVSWPAGFDPSLGFNNYKFSITGTGTGTGAVTLTASIEGIPGSTTIATDDGTVGGPILASGKAGFDFNVVGEGKLTSFQVMQFADYSDNFP